VGHRTRQSEKGRRGRDERDANHRYVSRERETKLLSDLNILFFQGDLGYQYLHRTDDSTSLFSRSAPLPSIPTPPRDHSTRTSESSNSSSNRKPSAGHVVIIDLASSPSSSHRRRRIAHFSPSRHPVVLISLAPSGMYCLTADSEGKAFRVFELRPPGPIRRSGVVRGGGSEWDDVDDPPKVWDRYRLNRGKTLARATGATWTLDGKWLVVTTSTGTGRE
jgi:hypothetical protein